MNSVRDIVASPGWKTVAGGFLVHLVLGTLYCWANITSSVTSYLRVYDSSVTYNKTILVYASALAAQGATMLLGGLISQRIGSSLCCLMGSFVIVCGAFLASMSTTATEMILCQGVLFGIGIGLCYTAPISAAVRWLPNNKGLVTGIIVGGFGCGAFVFGLIATAVVNPNHQGVNQQGPHKHYFSPDSPVVSKVPFMFRVLACAYTVCLLAGCMLMTEPPGVASSSNVVLSPRCSEDEATGTKTRARKLFVADRKRGSYQATATSDEDHKDSTSGLVSRPSVVGNPMVDMEMISNSNSRSNLHSDKSFRFANATNSNTVQKPEEMPLIGFLGPSALLALPLAWHLSSCLITTTVGGMYVAGTFKVYGQSHFTNEAFLAGVSSCASLFNSGGRIFWGTIADKFGPLRTLIVMSAAFAVILATYPASVNLGPTGFALWTFSVFFCEGANFVLYVPLTVTLFGSTHSASNYGMIFSAYSACTVLNIFLLADANVRFAVASWLMAGLTAFGCLNLLLLDCHIARMTRKKTAAGPVGCAGGDVGSEDGKLDLELKLG